MTYRLKQTAVKNWLPVLLVIFFPIILYGVWRQYFFSADDLQYATIIQRLATGETIFHPAGGLNFLEAEEKGTTVLASNPRYILEWPTSILAVSLFKVLGWEGDAIIPILTTRLVAGVVGLLFLYLAFRRLTNSTLISLLAILGISISDSYWSYSTHLDQTISMVMWLCIGFYFLVRYWQKNSKSDMVLVLTSIVVASLYNFTAVITAGAFITALAVFTRFSSNEGKSDLKAKASLFIKLGILYGVFVGVIILALLMIFTSPGTLFSAEFWRSATFQGHPEYLVDPIQDGIRAVLGFFKSLITYPKADGSLQEFWNNASTTDKLSMLLFYGIIMCIKVLPIGYFALHLRKLGKYRELILITFIWIIFISVFNWIWDPGYIKYWIMTIIAGWLLVAMFLSLLRDQYKKWYPYAVGLFVVFGLVGFTINFTSKFLPQSDPDKNPNFVIAQTLREESDSKDLFISTGQAVDFYITYFSRRNLVAPNLIVYGSAGDPAAAIDVVNNHIDQHSEVNGKIFFVSRLTEVPSSNDWLKLLSLEPLNIAWQYDDLIIQEVIIK